MPFLHQNLASSTRLKQVNPRHAKRRGQALLEAAFVMPFLLIFMMGILQFGLVYHAKLAMEHACRDGARYAAVHGREKPPVVGSPLTADYNITARIQKSAQNMGLGLKTSDITIGPPSFNTAASPSNRPLYSTLPITVTYDMNKRRIIPGQFYIPIANVTVTLPIFAGPYSITENVVLEGADVP